MSRLALFALLAISGCAAVAPAPAADLTFPDRGRAAVVDAAPSSSAPVPKPTRLPTYMQRRTR